MTEIKKLLIETTEVLRIALNAPATEEKVVTAIGTARNLINIWMDYDVNPIFPADIEGMSSTAIDEAFSIVLDSKNSPTQDALYISKTSSRAQEDTRCVLRVVLEFSDNEIEAQKINEVMTS